MDIVNLIMFVRGFDPELFNRLCNNSTLPQENCDLIRLHRLLVQKLTVSNLKLATTSAGQVGPDDICGVILHGNIREQMTMIMNFATNSCDLIWALIKIYLDPQSVPTLPPYISKPQLDIRIARIGVLLGASDKATLRESILKIATLACTSKVLKGQPCMVVSFNKNSAVSLSRTPALSDNLRTRRKEFGNLSVDTDSVFPPLSDRERKFTGLNVGTPQTTQVLPWITGHMYWRLNDDALHVKLGRQFSHDLIAGPSGNTDLQLDVLQLFLNFDVKKAVLACIIWMCNPPDHSVHEILLAAIPYGIQYDSMRQNEYDFGDNILSEVAATGGSRKKKIIRKIPRQYKKR
jgi:hypothetical protein